jgi:dihydrofolate reductase
MIVAMAKNGVIGARNRIPWHLPAELIMGRKTWESINRLLPGRTSVIVTRREDYQVPGAVVVHDMREAIGACAGDDEIFVIGGAELFADVLPLADRLYLTTVDIEPAGDTFMPPIDFSEWREVSSAAHPADERNPYSFRYAVYERVRGARGRHASSQ